jgi:hypothetical protein
MQKLIEVLLAVVFVALLCEVAFSEEPAAGPDRQQMREIMTRLRELSQELRDARLKAMNDPEVTKAFEPVRKAQEVLRKAQEEADKALDAAIIKANPDLAKAVKERRSLLEKLPAEYRSRLMGGAMMGGAPGQRTPGARSGTRPERAPRSEQPAESPRSE